MIEDAQRGFQILLVNTVVILDEGHLGRMNGGLADQAMIEVDFDLAPQGLGIVEMLKDRRRQGKALWDEGRRQAGDNMTDGRLVDGPPPGTAHVQKGQEIVAPDAQ